MPERSIAICKAPHGERPQVEILTKIHRHLLNWVQLQRRNLVINKIKVRPIELPPYKILCTPVRHASGRVVGFLALFREEDAPGFDARTERLVELLARKTTTALANNFDSLTALLTRSAFETQIRGQLAARKQPAPECVLYMDVDRMHVVNDNFGMHVGDELIGKVAEVLRKKPRPGALAARIAGDRFAVFLPDCTLDFAQQIGDMVRRQCAELTYARGDGTVQVSVSMGVAELPPESQEPPCTRARQRGDRLQGCEGSRPRPGRGVPGRGPEHHPAQHRHHRGAGACTRRSRRTALRCSRSRSCRSAPSTPSRASNSCCA